jgi:hypothetical protein
LALLVKSTGAGAKVENYYEVNFFLEIYKYCNGGHEKLQILRWFIKYFQKKLL